MDGLITIVVPVYNVEKYLDRCVESITRQTYQNLEIILVDDGSPDRCPQKCDEWADRDKRIKVIHKQNAGLGMARNTGIDNAAGEYICFFDSDDYIRPDAIEKIAMAAHARNADVVIYGYCLMDKDAELEEQVIPRVERDIYDGNMVRTVLLPDLIAPDPRTGVSKNLLMSAWASAYSAALIKKGNWRFTSERDIIAEDVYSLLGLYQYVDRVAVIQEALYCYCKNEESLSRRYRADRFVRIKEFYTESLELCRKAGYIDEVSRRISGPFISFTIAALKQIMATAMPFGRKWPAIRQIMGDDLLNGVIQDRKGDRVPVTRRIFLEAVRHRWYLLSMVFLEFQLIREKKGK